MTDCKLQTDFSFRGVLASGDLLYFSFRGVLASGDLLRAKRMLYTFTRSIQNIEKWNEQEWQRFEDLHIFNFPHLAPFIKEKNAFALICGFQQDLYAWLSAVVATGHSFGELTNLVVKSTNILQWEQQDERWERLKERFSKRLKEVFPSIEFSPSIEMGKNVVFALTVIEWILFDDWKEIVGNVKNKKTFGGSLEDLGDESESEEEDTRHPFHDIGCDGNHEVYNC
jgi:hypothetical protein